LLVFKRRLILYASFINVLQQHCFWYHSMTLMKLKRCYT
jgi:hypothetical protein